MRIGIFGGSFNPVHFGHYNLCKSLFAKGAIDKLIVIPVFSPPHKSSRGLESAQNRMDMLKIAFREEIKQNLAVVSDVEIREKSTSYTIDTVKKLRLSYPKDELYLIVGSDMLLSFRQWWKWEEILENVSLLAVSRENGDRAKLEAERLVLEKAGGRVELVDIDVREISSTEIRERLKNGKETDELLDGKVLEYILKNKLYR